MKILYAAGNNGSAKIQLSRFLTAVQDKDYTIKIAAYKKSSPTDVSIDWTLDCLLNIFKKDHISLDNDNFNLYYEKVKSFEPDLIISDLEYFTSHIASVLNIAIFQCSSLLINNALTKKSKYNLGIFKTHSYTFNRNGIKIQRILNMIENSNKNYIYAHYGDMDNPPEIKDNYEWVRPYHQVGKISIPCQHNLVGITPHSNKNIINILKKQNDCVLFTDAYNEKYNNLQIKNIANEEEYFCNLQNSKGLVCEGQTSFLADAFYNNKPATIYTNYNDPECILNHIISEKLIGSNTMQLNNVLYLHEQIERIL